MVAVVLMGAFAFSTMASAWGDDKWQPWYTWADMNCGEPGAELYCPQPDVADDASCKDSCDGCTHCVATVVSYAIPGQPKCLFKGCDTSCGCYQGGGEIACKAGPPAAAFASQHLTLHSRGISPHFCRQFAYDHHGVAGSVAAYKPYFSWTGMDCNEPNAEVLQCAEPAEATPERCQIACDDCQGCVAAVLFKGDGGKARCEFRGCDTSCGCYSQGSGQCSQGSPPVDAHASKEYDLFSKVITPHFCRGFAYTHGGVAGHVVSKAMSKTNLWADVPKRPSEHSALKWSGRIHWPTAVLCIAVAAISAMASVSLWARAAHRQRKIVRDLSAADALEAQEAAAGTVKGELPADNFQMTPLLVS